MQQKKYTHSIGGKELTVELNNWAEQANGSVLVRLGDTVVLATATMGANPREGIDFFPLTVDYEEKFYATGKILGSRFVKRETRPSEEAILAGRLIDRAIRPRFDKRMRNDVQVIITVLSIDEENDPDILGLFAASLAVGISDIPWKDPIAGVRIGRIDNSLTALPTYQERENNTLDLAIAGTTKHINMIEAGALEISEEEFAQAVEWGRPFIQEFIAFQDTIIKACGKTKAAVPLFDPPEELRVLLKKDFSQRIEEAMFQKDKQATHNAIAAIHEDWYQKAQEEFPETYQRGVAEQILEEVTREIIHRRIIDKNERPDGRRIDEIRPLQATIGILPRVHGSGLFMRGETHALSTLTLGAPGDEQIVEGMEVRTKKRYLHHYNFPPYSTGDTKPLRGPGRREIGHGALAGKALLPMIPSRDEFPYTIRVVSEILSSNGSTSMASVCGSTLALMDGGVPIKKPVAGAAMGLMADNDTNYAVLTDLQGVEDHYGDMDFKVAGTRDGITAVQLDVKIEGLTIEMIRDILTRAHTARMKIMDTIESVIKEPRSELSRWAPRVQILKINPEKIGALIGPGGKVINEIIAETEAQIDIEDDGTVFITSTMEEGMKKALSLIKQVTRELKPGELLEGKVTRILDFGAFVEVGPRQEGLIHVSELAPWHVEKVTDIVKVGDIVPVKVTEIDEQGRVNLSLKNVPGRYSAEEIERGREANTRMSHSPRGGRRPGRSGGHHSR